MSQQKLELPQGWAETILGDIAIRLQAGGTPSTKNSQYYENGIIPFVKIDDITDSNSKYLTTTKVKITNQGLDDSSAWLVSENSILYSMYASYGFPIINKIKVATSQAIIVYQQPKDLISLEFVYYFLKFMGPFSATKGTTQKNLNAGIVRNYKILLPPLNEQKRIVLKIEELFSKIDSTKQSLEQTKLQLELYRKSLLKSALTGKFNTSKKSKCFTNDKIINLEVVFENESVQEILENASENHLFPLPLSWKWSTMNNVCDLITDGSHQTPKKVTYGKLILGAKNIRDNKIDFKNVQYVSEKDFEKETRRCNPKKNDVLLSCIGSVGRCAVVDDDTSFMLVRNVALLRPSKIIPKFLMYSIQSDFLQNWIKSVTSETVQKALFLTKIRALPISLPPLSEQEQIVSQIEQGFSLIENTTQIVESSLQNLQTMKMSVLKQAFEGKLVPQDPDDEPASILLEKIKSTKESQSTKQRRTKNVK